MSPRRIYKLPNICSNRQNSHSNNFKIRLHYDCMSNFILWFAKYSSLPRCFFRINFLLSDLCQIHLYCFEFHLRMFAEAYSEPYPSSEFWIHFWFILAPGLLLAKRRLHWYYHGEVYCFGVVYFITTSIINLLREIVIFTVPNYYDNSNQKSEEDPNQKSED